MDNEELHDLIAVQVRDVGLVDGDTACVVTDMILMALHGAGYEIQQKTASSGEILGDAGETVVKPVCPTCKGAGALFGPYDPSDCAPCPECTPATDPAPVCEWTRISEFDTVIHYSTPHGVMNDLHLWRGLQCSACHAPIKFTEAKP